MHAGGGTTDRRMSDFDVWMALGGLAGAAYMFRASLLSLISGTLMPRWAAALIGAVPLTMMPIVAAPVVLADPGTGVSVPAAAVSGVATLAVGLTTRSLLGAFVTGLVAYHGFVWSGS